MRIEDLPAAAEPCMGESVYSWLDATRLQLGLEEAEWRQWCEFEAKEPERRIGGAEWGRLPPELGRIERVPSSWRIAAEWRSIGCAMCTAPTQTGVRYPVQVDWLDARAIACSRHRLLLSYAPYRDSMPLDANEELLSLWQWLEDWRHGQVNGQDARLRRDLVLASARNWGPGFGGIASAELAWSIEGAGWALPKPHRTYQPLGPARVGRLAPNDRAAALLGAYRAWTALAAASAQNLPKWPFAAWEWLARRWRHGDRRLEAMLAGIVIASRGGRRR